MKNTIPKKIPVLFSRPKKISASFIDPKKSLLAEMSDPPVIKICEWGPGTTQQKSKKQRDKFNLACT